jgi:acyl-CoA dehydrogenase
MSFLQDPPRPVDLYAVDPILQSELRRYLPQQVFDSVRGRFEELGRDTAGCLYAWAAEAEAQQPVHVAFDPWGKRVDRIDTCPAWSHLKGYSATHGIVATGYETALGEHRRVVQAALLHLFSASSAIFSCPLAMTDAAARVLIDSGTPELAGRLVPRLLSRDPEAFITSGQWMTERSGGSDVGGTETLARPQADGSFALHGVKWFTSATTSEMALALGRIDDGVDEPVAGSRGLTLFAVDVVRRDGQLQGLRVERLKDKLGTKALPTAELTLEGVAGWQVGEAGRGVPTIATMLNITRFYNAVSSCSAMGKALWWSRDYAGRRQAFGQLIQDHPLHAWTLDGMEAEYAGALAMAFQIASALGRFEQGLCEPDELQRLRGLIPLGKLTLGKQAVRVVSEALECFGGAGYVEDTGLPVMLRDAQVLSIWEGTTNVLSLDLLRAEAKDGAVRAVIEDLQFRAQALGEELPLEARSTVRATLERLSLGLQALLSGGDRGALEARARDAALTLGYLVQAVLLGEAAASPGADAGAGARFERFVADRLSAPWS